MVEGARNIAIVAALTVVLGTAAAAPAQAPEPSHVLLGTTQQTGYIDLGFLGPVGSKVNFYEDLNASIKQLIGQATVEANGAATVLKRSFWRCDRSKRDYSAVATTPDGRTLTGSFEVVTPSCANRILIKTPEHVENGKGAKVRIADRWGLGTPVDVCVEGAGRARGCEKVTLKGGARKVLSYKAKADGQLRIAVAVEGHRIVRTVAAGRAKPKRQVGGPVLLATGDSMIQGIDAFLADRLGSSADVQRQFFPASGLTTPGYSTSWLDRSRIQVKELRPVVTVVAIGANDGYPIAGVECCGPAWVAKYARRQRALMKSYLREGKGHLVWLTLPVPQDPERQIVTAAVNRATGAAAKDLSNLKVLDLNPIFAPDGRYHAVIEHEGRRQTVREPDGIHLNVAGAAIATEAVIAAVNEKRWLD